MKQEKEFKTLSEKMQRISNKMLKEMDIISESLKIVVERNQDCIKLIPDYYKELLGRFEESCKKVLPRGWDYGHNTYWYARKLKDKLKELEK